ncbi:MAG: hypothetical protein ACU85U_01435 [Gammaproteobacteria bacterium]|jgi:hypothetical protein
MVTRILPSNGLRAAVCGICFGVAQTAIASSVLTHFDFDTEPGGFTNGPDVVATGLVVPGWYAVTGTVSDFSGVQGRALAARNFSAGNALVLDITIAPGLVVNPSGVAFDHVASASGPTRWTLHIAGTDVIEGTTPPAFERVDGTFALGPISDALRIELRGLGASSNIGTYRIDNFELRGSIRPVPLPATIVFLGSVAGLLPFTRRRLNLRSGTGLRRRVVVAPLTPLIE